MRAPTLSIATLRSLFRPAPPSDAGHPAAAPQPRAAFFGSLADIALDRPCQVTGVDAPAQAPDWARWLAEIGFVAGEPALVTARSPWGDGALVVRIGSSQFALRRDEARCVSVHAS